MTPRSFDYVKVSTLEEAVEFLSSSKSTAKLLAGGQSLVPLMKLRLVAPDLLIDINGIRELSYVVERDDSVAVGALTRYKEILTSRLVRGKYPILIDAVENIADSQIRNRGTIGGNVCHADPASDLAPALIALKANFKVFGSEGKTRIIESEKFFLDVFTPNLEAGEILREIEIPKPLQRSCGAYVKFSEVSGGFAIVGVAVQLTLGEDGLISDAGVGLASVGSTPLKARNAEHLLLNNRPSRELIEKASREASGCVQAASDVQASTRYRKHLTGVLFNRAASKAVAKLGVKI